MIRKISSLFIICALVFGSLLSVALVMSVNVSATEWSIETVVSDDFGYTSLALDSDGNPHLAYSGFPGGGIMYARWTGSEWNIETVDTNSHVGEYASLALDRYGNPHIAYYVDYPYDLMHAKWTGSNWMIDTVDSVGYDDARPSMALTGSGYPVISYSYSNVLYLASWKGTYWTIDTVDDGGTHSVGGFTSLAMDDGGDLHISYLDITDNTLKYATGKGNSWDIDYVDINTYVGEMSSIALDDNDDPHISYHDHANDDVKYASLSGSSWSLETVFSDGEVGWCTSLALDDNGHPHISFYVGDTLMYAEWTGSDWSIETVEDGIGLNPSLALDNDGSPHISYSNDNDDLRYAREPPIAPPQPPTNLQTTVGDGLITLSWTSPSDDGGSPVTNYNIYRGNVSDGETFLTTVGDVTTHGDDGLTNGQTYYYKVSAVNGVGESDLSGEVSSTPTVGSGIGDTDLDGLPDTWEILYFGNLAQDSGNDYDGDGYSNIQEYLGGSNPTISSDHPVDASDGGNLALLALLAIVAVVAVVGILIFTNASKHKKPEGPEEWPSEPPSEQTQQQEYQPPTDEQPPPAQEQPPTQEIPQAREYPPPPEA